MDLVLRRGRVREDEDRSGEEDPRHGIARGSSGALSRRGQGTKAQPHQDLVQLPVGDDVGIVLRLQQLHPLSLLAPDLVHVRQVVEAGDGGLDRRGQHLHVLLEHGGLGRHRVERPGVEVQLHVRIQRVAHGEDELALLPRHQPLGPRRPRTHAGPWRPGAWTPRPGNAARDEGRGRVVLLEGRVEAWIDLGLHDDALADLRAVAVLLALPADVRLRADPQAGVRGGLGLPGGALLVLLDAAQLLLHAGGSVQGFAPARRGLRLGDCPPACEQPAAARALGQQRLPERQERPGRCVLQRRLQLHSCGPQLTHGSGWCQGGRL
mmetsp:Transcript_60075/g.178869  ORF Transcript_60075/g.178869 Transcript_60075/m.178869 type:complete len:322 (+) Transcript_60075:184-1149(+)